MLDHYMTSYMPSQLNTLSSYDLSCQPPVSAGDIFNYDGDNFLVISTRLVDVRTEMYQNQPYGLMPLESSNHVNYYYKCWRTNEPFIQLMEVLCPNGEIEEIPTDLGLLRNLRETGKLVTATERNLDVSGYYNTGARHDTIG